MGMNPKKGFKKYSPCCNELEIRHNYRRYHRFFIFSPMFLMFALGMAFFASRGELPSGSYRLLVALLVLITLKELVGVLLSRRIYNQVLRPVEELKKALFEVSRGNYGVEVTPTRVDEFNQLVQAFNAMSIQLKASEELKIRYESNRKELVASISHDLKTPITSINGFIDGIVDGVADSPEKQEAYFKIIQQNARYMNRLVDDLLLYAKLDMHKMSFEFIEISIGDYVEELFRELELENEEHGVSMSYDNGLLRPIELQLDAKHLTRAIRNIVSNAVAYGPEVGGKIAFTLNEDALGEWVTLSIVDNGPGIPEEQLERIFERFYRGDDARTMMSGSSGLGLAIAKEIIQAHGGQIRAESVLGMGTTLHLSLPVGSEVPLCPNQES